MLPTIPDHISLAVKAVRFVALSFPPFLNGSQSQGKKVERNGQRSMQYERSNDMMGILFFEFFGFRNMYCIIMTKSGKVNLIKM